MTEPEYPAIAAQKARAREDARARLKAISRDRWIAASQRICARLGAMPEWVSASGILAYVSIPAEVALEPLMTRALSAGRRIGVPRVAGDGVMHPVLIRDLNMDIEAAPGFKHLRHARQGLPPMGLESIDVVLVPGLAFDPRGGRLGRGKGYYDRLITGFDAIAKRPLLIGVGIDAQIVEQVPTEGHDRPLNMLVTETKTLVFPGTGRR
jgi:5-formyltetrahydrofolate cyclo-ligase